LLGESAAALLAASSSEEEEAESLRQDVVHSGKETGKENKHRKKRASKLVKFYSDVYTVHLMSTLYT